MFLDESLGWESEQIKLMCWENFGALGMRWYIGLFVSLVMTPRPCLGPGLIVVRVCNAGAAVSWGCYGAATGLGWAGWAGVAIVWLTGA